MRRSSCSACLLLSHHDRLGIDVHGVGVVLVAGWSATNSSSAVVCWRPHVIVELLIVAAEDALATQQPEDYGEENERCDPADDSSSDWINRTTGSAISLHSLEEHSLAPVLEEEPPLPAEAELSVPAEVMVVGRPSLPVLVTTTVRKLVMVEGSRVVTGGGAAEVEEEEEDSLELDGSAEVLEEDSGSGVVAVEEDDDEEEGGGVVVVLNLVVVVVDSVVDDEEELLELEVETAWQLVDSSPRAVEREMEVTVESDSEMEPCCAMCQPVQRYCTRSETALAG